MGTRYRAICRKYENISLSPELRMPVVFLGERISKNGYMMIFGGLCYVCAVERSRNLEEACNKGQNNPGSPDLMACHKLENNAIQIRGLSLGLSRSFYC